MAVVTKARHKSHTRRIEEKAIHPPEDVRQRIAEKAYALYEQHGRREGYALEDWLEGEHIVNQELFDTH